MKRFALIALLLLATPAMAYPIWSGGGTGGAGGAVSITSASNGIVVTPSPITGTGTVGDTTIINAQTTTTPYPIATTDIDKLVTHNKTTAVAVTLSQAGSTGFESGKSFCDMNLGSGIVTITPATSTINGLASVQLMYGQEICPVSDGANYQGIIGSIPINPQTVTISGAAIATNFQLGPIVYATLSHTGSTTVSNPTNAVDGQFLLYVLTQDSTGTNLASFGTSSGGFDFGVTGAPTLSTGANKVDYIGFRYNANISKWVYQGQALGN